MQPLRTNTGFAFSVTGPIMLVLALGALLARRGIITDAFIDAGSRLVFNVTLPALLFITISQTDFEYAVNVDLIVLGVIATLVVYLTMEILANRLVYPGTERGVVVQGAYRSNMGIVGLAYCVNAYGDIALAVASLYLGLITILYNVLAVITLNRSLNRQRSIVPTIAGILRNPLILGIVAALPLSYFNISLPAMVLQTGDYFAQMTLPLALLCTGGSLSLRALRADSLNAGIATIGKIILAPLILTGAAFCYGFREIELGIVFLMSSAPTATASYVMVRAMQGNATLAANIIGLSTIGSVIVTSLGVTLLRATNLM